MLHLRYDTWCTLQVVHDYFNRRTSTAFEFTPTLDTQRRMRDAGLLFKNLGEQAFLLFPADNTFADLQDIGSLSFLLTLRDRRLARLSDWGSRRFFYLSNLDADGQVRGLLTEGETLSDADAVLPVKTTRFTEPIAPNKYQSVKLLRIGTPENTALKTMLIPEGREAVTILVNQPGRYSYTFEGLNPGDTESTAYYADDEAAQAAQVLAVVQLFLHAGQKGTDYEISIKPKTSLWRYVLIYKKDFSNPDADPFPDLVVELPPAETVELEFVPLRPDEWDDDLRAQINLIEKDPLVDQVFVFESNRLLAIRERLSLRLRAIIGGKSILLPLPSLDTPNTTLFVNI